LSKRGESSVEAFGIFCLHSFGLIIHKLGIDRRKARPSPLLSDLACLLGSVDFLLVSGIDVRFVISV